MKINPFASSASSQTEPSSPIGKPSLLGLSAQSELLEFGGGKVQPLWIETVSQNILNWVKSIWNFFFGKHLNTAHEVKGKLKSISESIDVRDWRRCLYVVQSGDKVLKLCRTKEEDSQHVEKRIKHWLMKQDENQDYSIKALTINWGSFGGEYLETFVVLSTQKLGKAQIDFAKKSYWGEVPDEQIRKLFVPSDKERFDAMQNLKHKWDGDYLPQYVPAPVPIPVPIPVPLDSQSQGEDPTSG